MMPHCIANLQQQGKGKLRHRSRAVVRHIAYRNIPFAGGITVHYIVAGGQHAHQLNVGATGKGVLGEGRLVGHHDFCVANAVGDLMRLGEFIYCYIAKGFEAIPTQVAGVDCVTVKDNDFHRNPPFGLKNNGFFATIT